VNWADLIGVEPSGRLVIIEVKPNSIEAVEAAVGTPLGVGRAVPIHRIDDGLLELLRTAYEEARATSSRARGHEPPRRPAPAPEDAGA